MATYKPRGNTHSVVYPYKTESKVTKQQWETYTTELEAVQRKAYIDYLQKTKNYDAILKAVNEYKEKRATEKAAQAPDTQEVSISEAPALSAEDNYSKTYKEFIDKWLPLHARKKRISPNTYDSYVSNLNVHIIPYFGQRVMSTITAEEIDDFIDGLSRKPCKGPKSYRKNPSEVPTLASGTIKKCYNIINAGLPYAKKWKYVKEIPDISAPVEKYKKRNAWDATQMYPMLCKLETDRILHLAVHLAFVCSLRAGETVGISITTIDPKDNSLWISQEVQRVSDESLAEIPKNEIILVFPKQVPESKSSLILKGPKTAKSVRKQYLTAPLMTEIKERLEQIKQDKEFLGTDYQDHGLLICNPDGKPFDPKALNGWFKQFQRNNGVENLIEFQGLRKSGQMHKVRLSQNNFQLVAEMAGQSSEVLMSNYNDVLDSEKRSLSQLVEANFYPVEVLGKISLQKQKEEQSNLLQSIENDPELMQQFMQFMQANAVGAK